MPQRRFLIASSFARLIRRDQDMVGRIVEGYFPARPERDHFISIEPGHCFLVLAPTSEAAGVEERTEIPALRPTPFCRSVPARWALSARSCGCRAARRLSCNASWCR